MVKAGRRMFLSSEGLCNSRGNVTNLESGYCVLSCGNWSRCRSGDANRILPVFKKDSGLASLHQAWPSGGLRIALEVLTVSGRSESRSGEGGAAEVDEVSGETQHGRATQGCAWTGTWERGWGLWQLCHLWQQRREQLREQARGGR